MVARACFVTSGGLDGRRERKRNRRISQWDVRADSAFRDSKPTRELKCKLVLALKFFVKKYGGPQRRRVGKPFRTDAPFPMVIFLKGGGEGGCS